MSDYTPVTFCQSAEVIAPASHLQMPSPPRPIAPAADALSHTSQLWVLLPAYNEEHRIEATLRALAAQDDKEFTLCVIDNGSRDATPSILRRFRSDTPMRVVILSEPAKGVGYAVDTGARYAIEHGAVFLARTDADSVPDRTWTREVRRALSSGVELACGALHARRDENGPLARLLFRAGVLLVTLAYSAQGLLRSPTFPAHPLYAGFNMAISAHLYRRCGGMPRRASPTDRRFMAQAVSAGGRVAHVRAMRVETSTRRFRALGLIGAAKWYLDGGAEVEDPR